MQKVTKIFTEKALKTTLNAITEELGNGAELGVEMEKRGYKVQAEIQ